MHKTEPRLKVQDLFSGHIESEMSGSMIPAWIGPTEFHKSPRHLFYKIQNVPLPRPGGSAN